MPRPASPVRGRRLTAAALATAPVLLAMAVPAAAAVSVQVTSAPEVCGVVVMVTGLGEGAHTAVVRATVVASGEPVPVLPETVVPDPDVPVTDVPATDAAATDAPGTDALATDAPATDALATDAPATDALATDAPATDVPASDALAPSDVPALEPVLSAERTVTGDGEVVVVLDATAVPDDDPRIAVDVTVDGAASPTVELALPICGEPAPAPTTTTPTTTTPTTTTPTTTTPTTPPAAELTTTSGSTAEPNVPASPTDTLTATPSPETTSPDTAAAEPATSPTATPTTASPVLTGDAPVPALASSSQEQAHGAVDGGTGTSGSLSLVSFAAAPQLEADVPEAPVPAPVIAAPEGSPAGVLPAEVTSTPLEDLLPLRPADDDHETVPAQLAAPELATGAAADPLVDLAPAVFVLSASLGGLLMAGRRRTA